MNASKKRGRITGKKPFDHVMPSEIAEAGGLHENTVRNAIRRGELSAERIGKPDHPIYIVKVRDANKFLERYEDG